MATHTAYIFADAESSSVIGFNLGSSGNRITLGADDTLSVNHSAASPNSAGAATVSGFSTSAWVSSSDLSVSRNSTESKDVKSSPTESTFDLSVSINGYTSATIYIEVVSAVDTEPDDFSSSLSNITNAVPGVEYALGNFVVAGINTQVTASVSGTASTESRVGNSGAKNSTNKNVDANDRIYVWGTASTSYNASTTATIQVGSRTVSKTITTRTDPAVGTRIPFTPSSGTVSLDDVRSFFGPKTGSASMSNYYRGGSYVIGTTTGSPNNSGVPASGTIQLDDFYNSFTTMFFSTSPGNKEGFINTTSAGGTTAFNWNRVDDWEVGYGPDMEDGVDYRITHETTTFQELINNVTTYKVTFNGVDRDLTVAANRSAYSFGYVALGGSAIDVTLTAPQSTEAFISGEITLQIRHKEQPTYTYSTTFYYDYTIFGP